MKVEYIRHNAGNRALILIFAGWSTGPSLYRDVHINGWDTAVVYDYTESSTDFSFLDSYSTIWLFAWSLGVKMAAAVLPAHKITAAYAINGTLNPVDDHDGIPTAIYNGTALNLDARNLKKFRRRMAPDAETYRQRFDTEFSEEEIAKLRQQLYLIRDLDKPCAPLPWRRAYIATGDRIFPPDNMMRSWRMNNVEIVKTPAAHYIPLTDIVRAVIPDCSLIARKFGQASATYNKNAIAQQRIARRLVCNLDRFKITQNADVLEIGPGTGMFSRLYAEKIKPARIDFVDIASVPAMGIAGVENYHCEDAEKWIYENKETYDCIFSASTIQWFVNIPEFLRNCRRSLRAGGVILMSSFLPGNLGELDPLRPSPIHYHSIESYREWMKRYFTNIEIFTEDITLEFSSPRELMLHLRLTGVSGSAPSPHVTPSSLRSIRSITYRPVYLAATRP